MPIWKWGIPQRQPPNNFPRATAKKRALDPRQEAVSMFRAALDEGDDVDKVPLAAGWCGG